MKLTRRNLFALALAPAVPIWALPRRDFSFRHDYILGTSLDLTILGSSRSEAQAAEQAALAEIQRLNTILNVRDPQSEVNQRSSRPSEDLRRVLAAYAEWEQRTNGVISAEIAGRFNLDALGKAYVVDRAAEAARAAAPNARGVVVDIGGDVRVIGETRLTIADPANAAENADPLTAVRIADRALASSGTYARGAHIVNPRTGQAAQGGAWSATVTAADCVTANALSTALCVLSPAEGLQLLEDTPNAEGILVTPKGGVLRSSGFRRYEEVRFRRAMFAGWPNSYQVSVTFTLKDPEPQAAPGGGAPGGPGGGGGRFGGPGGFGGGGFGGGGFGRLRRPYVVVWAEDANGKVVRNISLWASKPRYIADLRTWWRHNGSAAQGASQMARATRAPGEYTVVWNGQNDAGEQVPPGTYKIWIETNREHGTHYEESTMIECSTKPASAEMKATPEFIDIKVEYGKVAGVA